LAEVFNIHRAEVGESLITVTEVRLSKDYEHASVWVSIYNAATDRQDVLRVLNRLSGRFRHLLSNRAKLRKVPELHFKIDETLDHAHRIDELLKQSGINFDAGHDVVDE
jgi:ribosome-binding factor A